MKKQKKTLTLAKETLRSLTRELAGVRGGKDDGPFKPGPALSLEAACYCTRAAMTCAA